MTVEAILTAFKMVKMILHLNDRWLFCILGVFRTSVATGAVSSLKILVIKFRPAFVGPVVFNGGLHMATRTFSNLSGAVFLKKLIITVVPSVKRFFLSVQVTRIAIRIDRICRMSMQQLESIDIEFDVRDSG